MKILIPMLLLVSACLSNKRESIRKLDVSVSKVSSPFVRTIPFDPQNLKYLSSLKSKLIKVFPEYKELKGKDIKEVRFKDSIEIANFGIAQIYQINLSDDLPEVFLKKNYFIVNKERKIGAVFLLDSLFYIKKKSSDSSCLLGGIQKAKAKGFFKLYDFNGKDRFDEILNTLDSCDNGIPVFNNGLECKSYIPECLNFRNTDENGDGLLDINFSGKIASYCKGLETGYGRMDRKPISLEEASFSFILKMNKNTRMHYEILDKERICSKL